MRILVEARTLTPASRVPFAAAALAARGHLVRWSGGLPPADGIPRVEGVRALAREGADVVIGGSRDPLRLAGAARFSHARVALLDLDPAHAAAWTGLDRWAIASSGPAALVEPRAAEAARTQTHGIPLEGIGLWPEEPPATEADPAHLDAEVLERAAERALRRRRSRAPEPAAFLDRDGTLVVERGYLTDPSEIELLPGVAEGLHRLRAAGHALVVISNQSGVGRGFFSEATVHRAMARLRRALRAHGIELDAIYFCPHRPEAGCDCRKPGTGLLLRARDDLELSLGRSTMIGDKLIDAETGRRAGGRGLLVRTGYGRDEEQLAAGAVLPPDAVVDDLAEAARWVVRHPVAGPLD